MEIKNRFSGNVIFSKEGATTREAAETAVKAGVSLAEADLAWVDLYGANLREANLRLALLRRANLSGANLKGANLRGANLQGATLPSGIVYENYLKTLPELLQAGGKTIEEVAQHWDCHSWENCPMACAFGTNSLEGVPEEWQERADEFVKLFDTGLLPRPA